MGAGRLRGRHGSRTGQSAVTLIELLVSVSILAGLLAMALPAFSEWIRNNQIRVAAESLREGLQLARSEAVKRNARVRLQLVDKLDNSCALSSSGPYWIVNVGASISPAGACATAVSATVSPFVVQASPVTAATSKVSIASSQPVVTFDAAGRQAATTSPATAVGKMTIAVTSPTGACVQAGGTMRCLNVLVSTAGQIRMCDPAQSGSTDPTRC